MINVLHLLDQLGYIIIPTILYLELLAFPFPGELLMTYSGYLVYNGTLNYGVTILVAALGAMAGITTSYFIGRLLEDKFIKKYGHYVHLKEEQIEKTSLWFEKYGNKLLVVAFFIPGVRHITGYFSGIAKLSYRQFAKHAYSGALIWSLVFVSLGKVLGSKWSTYSELFSRYMVVAGAFLVIVFIAMYLFKMKRQSINSAIVRSLKASFAIFHSMGKIKFFIAFVSVAFTLLIVALTNLIDSILENELVKYDNLITYIIRNGVGDNNFLMSTFAILSSVYVLITAIFITLIVILTKGKDKLLEATFTVVGFAVVTVTARSISAAVSFASADVILPVFVYGFLFYILLKDSKAFLSSSFYLIMPILLIVLNGISAVYFKLQYPSHILTGYCIGGILLSLNIIMLEVYRVLPNLRYK